MNAWSHFWQETPVLQQLILPAIYVWIMAAALVYGLATRRRKVVVACVPLLLVLAAGCFSPVDGYTRYMLPLFICVPLLVALCKAPNSIDKNEYTTPENLKNAEGVTSLSLTA
jgi:peptidoglycan/LPS O-acetylase OafA/YrhL